MIGKTMSLLLFLKLDSENQIFKSISTPKGLIHKRTQIF